MTVGFLLCVACTACTRSENDLRIDVSKVDKSGIGRVNDQLIVVNVSNSFNRGQTEIWRTMEFSKLHKSDAGFCGGHVSFDRVEPDGTVVIVTDIKSDHEMRGKGGEMPQDPEGNHFGYVRIEWGDYERQRAKLSYLCFSSAERQ